MNIEGKRVRRHRWIHGSAAVVRVEVEAVIPDFDPRQACFEPKTVKFLKLVREKADAGDVAWLRTVGEVYARVPA